jgi:hypothetical protein
VAERPSGEAESDVSSEEMVEGSNGESDEEARSCEASESSERSIGSVDACETKNWV